MLIKKNVIGSPTITRKHSDKHVILEEENVPNVSKLYSSVVGNTIDTESNRNEVDPNTQHRILPSFPNRGGSSSSLTAEQNRKTKRYAMPSSES